MKSWPIREKQQHGEEALPGRSLKESTLKRGAPFAFSHCLIRGMRNDYEIAGAPAFIL